MALTVQRKKAPMKLQLFLRHPLVPTQFWAADPLFRASSASCDDFETKSSPESHSAGGKQLFLHAWRASDTC